MVSAFPRARFDCLPHALVDDDADGMSSDVEHATCFAVIESMGHTFLNSTISLDARSKEFDQSNERATDFDVDNVTAFVYFHVDRQWNATILLEIAGE
jgi:hypothetical protein